MSRLLKCGVIGLGRIGVGFDDNPRKTTINTHAGAYWINKQTRLVAFCDVDKKKLSKYGKKYNVSGLYTDFHDMFRTEKMDCVSICTLADSHQRIVEEAAKWNIKGIFLEKPIGDTLKSASNIIKTCNRKKIKLQIDHQRRFDPTYHKVKKIINSSRFGKIQHANVYYGAGIANTGSHLFDLIRYFFGNIKWVEGRYSENPSNNLSDPNIDGSVSCNTGIKCSLNSFDVNQYGILELDILGTRGRIRFNLAKSSVEYFENSKRKGLVYSELKPRPFNISKRKDAIVLGLEDLINAIEKNLDPLCSGIDGYSSLEAIIAMKISAERGGKRIHLPLKINNYKISSR